jgi:serine/threonine protein kinase
MLNLTNYNYKAANSHIPKTGLQVKFIDFGLSEFLSATHTSSNNSITLQGTTLYAPPELFAVSVINKNREYGDNNFMLNKYLSSSNEKIQKLYVPKSPQQLNVNNTKKQDSHIDDPEQYAKYLAIREPLFWRIKNLFDTNRILPAYFGTDTNKFNGYLQKSDVYSLGVNIYESIVEYNNDGGNFDLKGELSGDGRFYDLLLKMIEMEPDKRYNAIQALNHPYFM